MLEFTTYVQNKLPEKFSAQLDVRIHMFGDWGVGPKGEKLVTPELRNSSEVDFYIDRIIAALEQVRVEAKAKLEENQ